MDWHAGSACLELGESLPKKPWTPKTWDCNCIRSSSRKRMFAPREVRNEKRAQLQPSKVNPRSWKCCIRENKALPRTPRSCHRPIREHRWPICPESPRPENWNCPAFGCVVVVPGEVDGSMTASVRGPASSSQTR
jgi:hypothetical protein